METGGLVGQMEGVETDGEGEVMVEGVEEVGWKR